MHSVVLAADVIWSIHKRSDPRATPNIDILSLNSSELESNDMPGRFLLTRLEIRQHFVSSVLKLTKFRDPQFLKVYIYNPKWGSLRNLSQCRGVMKFFVIFITMNRIGGKIYKDLDKEERGVDDRSMRNFSVSIEEGEIMCLISCHKNYSLNNWNQMPTCYATS